MILHRDARSDLSILYYAEAFDTLGVRIVAINEDHYGTWHIWGQTSITDEDYATRFIDNFFDEKLKEPKK